MKTDNALNFLTRELMQDLYEELIALEARIKKLDKKIKQLCQESESCKRLLNIPGTGELTATAIVASVPNANEFKMGETSRLG